MTVPGVRETNCLWCSAQSSTERERVGVGTASLESVSGPVSAQPVFAIGNVPAGDAVNITVDVNYTCDEQSDSVDVSSSVEVLSNVYERSAASSSIAS